MTPQLEVLGRGLQNVVIFFSRRIAPKEFGTAAVPILCSVMSPDPDHDRILHFCE